MRRSCFLNKVASLQLDTLFKKDLLGQCLVATSENTWIQAYVSDTQKKQFFFIFQKIINTSKQRTLPNISLKYAWQISFWLEILFRK